MKNPIKYSLTLIILLLTALFNTIVFAESISPPTRSVATMLKSIQAYHKNAPDSNLTLRVVYFYPSDVEPQKDYQERVGRILLDIQDFYKTEMKRIGFGEVVFPLEKDEKGCLRIHVVKGRDPAKEYSYKSGQKVKQEMRRALKGVVDFDTEFVLAIHGLCRKEKDGSYFFHAPYYGEGGSNQRHGLCHAADCEMLDPLWFTETKKRVAYKEHNGTFNQTLANFNTKYLGGIAHELGHGLGLPHNGQTRQEWSRLGTALMGAGNHTYRREKWGKKGSFMTLATAARLASHPLFTGSERGRLETVKCTLSELRFDREEKDLIIEGSLKTSHEAYAVIAYLDPEGNSDYDALAWTSPVRDGKFRIAGGCARKGAQELRLVALHVNGAVTTLLRTDFSANEKLEPDTDSLSSEWLVRAPERAFLKGERAAAVEQVKETLQMQNVPEIAAKKLRHLLALTEPRAKPIAPDQVKGKEAFLSDLTWTSASVGWGQPARDQYYHNRSPFMQDALFLETGGVFYEKGLYAHAASRYAFKLDGAFKKFTATGGLEKGADARGSAVFIVKGDGRELFRSKLLKGKQTASINLAIEGIDVLELIVESGKQDNASCWSIWGAPKITR